MGSHEEAKRAIEGLNGRRLGNSILSCSFDKVRLEPYKEQANIRNKEYFEKMKGRILYVRNFDEEFSEEKLINIFLQFGQIESVNIIYDNEGVSKKYGFVCFRNHEDAQNWLKQSVFLFCQKRQFYVDYAKIPEQRKRWMTDYLNEDNKRIISKKIMENNNSNQLLLQRCRDISDEQAKVLVENEDLLAIWLNL